MSRMLSLFALAAAATLVLPAKAADPDWSRAQKIDIALSSFKFSPKNLHLKAGQPVVLHLVNTGKGGHDFSAPAFFNAATIRSDDRGKIDDGSVDVGAHQSVDIALVPAAGSYGLKCTHSFHTMFGMKGSITVQ